MKKLLLVLAICLCAIQSKAQIVTGLDEIALMGKWAVIECYGVWGSKGYSKYNWPASIEFNDGRESYFWVKRFGEANLSSLDFAGYWVSGTATNRYTLHFLRRRDYDNNYTGLAMINFVVKNFDGQTLTIETYDGNGTATYIKDSAGVNDITAEAPDAEVTTYNLNGLPVENPTAPGVYIQSDGKKVVK